MLIVMKPDASASEIERVIEIVETLGFRAHEMPGQNRTAIGITGNRGSVDPAHFENLPGVADAIRVTKPYKLISRDLRPEKSVIKVGNASIGGPELAVIAGPCAVETVDQVFAAAEAVAKSGARFFRGGAFKPRTSPYAFQGKGEDAVWRCARVSLSGAGLADHHQPERPAQQQRVWRLQARRSAASGGGLSDVTTAPR